MISKLTSKRLTSLAEFLESFEERIPVDQLGQFLSTLDIQLDDVLPFAKFADNCYQRNLICENDWYELLCICWESGQRSPIHNHAGSTCGLRVMKGVCTETVFVPSPSGLIKATHSTECTAGHVCSSQDSDIHQISNLQAPDQQLITLHIYSPPLRKMDTFSLYSAEVETYVPKNAPIECIWGDCI